MSTKKQKEIAQAMGWVFLKKSYGGQDCWGTIEPDGAIYCHHLDEFLPRYINSAQGREDIRNRVREVVMRTDMIIRYQFIHEDLEEGMHQISVTGKDASYSTATLRSENIVWTEILIWLFHMSKRDNDIRCKVLKV